MRQVAALRDRDRVRERLRQVGERRRHLGLRLEVLVGREALRPPRVGEHEALGDAHARLVRAEVLAAQELHRMRRDDRQPELAGERDGGGDERIVVGVAGALHLEVVAIRETARPTRAPRVAAPAALPCSERAADVAVARAGQRDQAVGAFGEPFAAQLRAAAMLVAAVGARQPVGEPQVAGARSARAAARETAGRARPRASPRRRSRRSA